MSNARHRVRPNDPDTSWEAAYAQTEGKVAVLQQAIYDALWFHGPMTHEALFEVLHLPRTPSGVRTRVAELVELGWVEKHTRPDGTVVTRRTRAGKRATVWRGVLPGARTGVDRQAVAKERRDPTETDAADLALLRAAVDDALRLYARAQKLQPGRLDADADAIMAKAADDMAGILRGLRHHPVDPTLDAVAFGDVPLEMFR